MANIGPGKKVWFDGHQEMEQALVRFGRFVNDVEGGGRGDAYIALARFLLESRDGGGSYDQSHLPPRQQYEALGHAVRAMYFYSGMADIAAETGDRDYQSAVASLHDNLVNRKYYVTGGIGSGDTPEGFGDDYALRNDGYCESCSSCGLVFFQYKLNLAYGDARYADAYEETMYNALLGAVDLKGQNFTYENPLVGGERARWHTCPVLRRQHSAHAAHDPDLGVLAQRGFAVRESVRRQPHPGGRGGRHAARGDPGDQLPVEWRARDHAQSAGGAGVLGARACAGSQDQRAVHAAAGGERLSVGARQW